MPKVKLFKRDDTLAVTLPRKFRILDKVVGMQSLNGNLILRNYHRILGYYR
jgi:virulence-associated protein VagC